MPKEKGECPCSGSQTGARSLGGPMEISPEALELLRTETVSLEFRNALRELVPNISMPSPAELDVTPTSSRVDMTSIEMPVPPVPVSWPEMARSDRGIQAFYLTDLTLDLSRVAHMTPGLRDLAYLTLSPIISNLTVSRGNRSPFHDKIRESDLQSENAAEDKSGRKQAT